MSPSFHPHSEIEVTACSPHLISTLTFKILLFNWRVYIIVLFQKNTTTTTTKNPPTDGRARLPQWPPLSAQEVRPPGSGRHPPVSWGRPRKAGHPAKAGPRSLPSSPAPGPRGHASPSCAPPGRQLHEGPGHEAGAKDRDRGQVTPVRGMLRVFRISTFN